MKEHASIKLKIADVVVEMKSRFPLSFSDEGFNFRFKNFIHKSNKKPAISIEVYLVRKLPKIQPNANNIFKTIHPDSKEINWALFRIGNSYILREYPHGKQQHYVLNKKFSCANAFLLKDKNEELKWSPDEVIYDALQVILIQYFSKNDGVFTHAVGMKDIDGRGLLFCGKSGQGKSTTARIWHKHSKAKILNDDRIIVRKINKKFFIYGTPWHGDFSDYLKTKSGKARLKSIFFIHHSKRNQATLCKRGSFKLFYPCIFPTFWDSQSLDYIISNSNQLLSDAPSYKLGFKNNKEIIKYVRSIK
jgi:hypothetical protein